MILRVIYASLRSYNKLDKILTDFEKSFSSAAVKVLWINFEKNRSNVDLIQLLILMSVSHLLVQLKL